MAVIKMGNKTLFTQTGNDNPKINTNIKEEDFYEFTGTINFNTDVLVKVRLQRDAFL